MKPRLSPVLASVLLLLAGAPSAQAQLPEVVPATAEQILADVRGSDAALTVLNVWATWCVPCREEFPALVRVGTDFGGEGVDVVFVSADFEEDLPAARQFLAEQGVTGPSYLKTGGDDAFVRTLHAEWSGALPATVVFGPDGRRLDFWEGKTSYAALAERLRRLLE